MPAPSLMVPNLMQQSDMRPCNVIGVGDKEIVLEYVCPACGGHARKDCKNCRGLGRVPSQEGQRIIALVNAHTMYNLDKIMPENKTA